MQPTNRSSRILLPARYWFVLFSLIAALGLSYIPTGRLAGVPDWVALVLAFWCIREPLKVGMGTAFAFGLLVDIGHGAAMGQHALAFTLIAYLTLKLHQRVRLYPLWQQSLTVLLLLMLHQLINMWVQGITGRPPQDWSYWLPSFIGMALWPFVYQLLRGLRRQFSVT